jgi:hypothetical protein
MEEVIHVRFGGSGIKHAQHRKSELRRFARGVVPKHISLDHYSDIRVLLAHLACMK